jgi:hypothetical protein
MGEGKKKEKLLLISLHTGSLYVCTAAIRSLSQPPVDVEHIDDVWIGRPADYYGSSSIRRNRNPIGSFPDSREYEIAGGNVDTKI